MLTSRLVSKEAWSTWMPRPLVDLGLWTVEPVYHRKRWEFAFIVQALQERGVLRPGCRGLGFGVGREPLPAYFRSLGCQVTATDLPEGLDAEGRWTETGQHDPTAVPLDMNDIPASYDGQFHFLWSSSTFEHLGTLEAGKAFWRRMQRCLVPGGVAAHTTEYNLTSEEETYVAGPVVVFRKADLIEMDPDIDLTVGDLGQTAETEAEKLLPHLKLKLGAYEITSAGLIYTCPQRSYDEETHCER